MERHHSGGAAPAEGARVPRRAPSPRGPRPTIEPMGRITPADRWPSWTDADVWAPADAGADFGRAATAEGGRDGR